MSWRDQKDLIVNKSDERKINGMRKQQWSTMCTDKLKSVDDGKTTNVRVVCEECHRTFSRESDKRRHKCTTEKLKLISQQKGAVHCSICDKWFCSISGFSVHNCRPDT